MTLRLRPPSNRWTAPTDYSSMTRATVPDVDPTVTITCHPKAAPLLTWIIWQVDKRAAPVNPRTTAAWNNRPIAGSDRWSTHATGAAVDINWDLWPMFRSRMTRAQRRTCTDIERRCKGAVVWGGRTTWVASGRVDEMHWEIVATPEEAYATGRRLWARALHPTRGGLPS